MRAMDPFVSMKTDEKFCWKDSFLFSSFISSFSENFLSYGLARNIPIYLVISSSLFRYRFKEKEKKRHEKGKREREGKKNCIRFVTMVALIDQGNCIVALESRFNCFKLFRHLYAKHFPEIPLSRIRDWSCGNRLHERYIFPIASDTILSRSTFQ